MDESRKGLGKHIRRLRRNAGLTQEHLAEKAELSLKHLGELERGKGNPTLSSLENLSRALDISLSDLLAYEAVQRSIEETRAEIARMISGATDQECRIIHRLLSALLR
jgi:transcriptional regulator with XRE-family HTH domain